MPRNFLLFARDYFNIFKDLIHFSLSYILHMYEFLFIMWSVIWSVKFVSQNHPAQFGNVLSVAPISCVNSMECHCKLFNFANRRVNAIFLGDICVSDARLILIPSVWNLRVSIAAGLYALLGICVLRRERKNPQTTRSLSRLYGVSQKRCLSMLIFCSRRNIDIFFVKNLS